MHDKGNMIVILTFSTLAILFIFLAIILNIREKKSIIKKETDKDFIDNFVKNKKEHLLKIPGAMSFKTYVTLCIVLPILFAVSSWYLSKNAIITTLLSLVSIFIPEMIIRLSERSQKNNFEERYARALRQLSNSLRAGMTLQQAVEDLCDCPFIHHEIRKEFKQVNADIKLGISVTDAFENMAIRLPTNDVKDVAAAIKMQSLVGGSEAESIEIISSNISSRIMLKKEIKSLFASVRMTVVSMDILPIFTIIFLYYSAPSYFGPVVSTGLGRLVLVVAIILMVLGSFLNRKMLNSVKGVE